MAGGGGGDSEYDVNINLTALLDILTNLLFFLMVGFMSSKASMELDGGMQLPTSTAQLEPKKAVQVTVARKELRVEKEVIANLRDGKVVAAKSQDGKIDSLLQRLQQIRKDKNVTGPEADILFVLCDKDTPYGLLRRVMMTAAEAGYPKFRMAVLMQ
jgi:biopolymer transport protein TolR